ncbi:hypothetical protein [Glycocaulis sp.]|uniref:hypothetical protein n=1 Tax=Glycocaulis sp. TaxID=1969725 RepID=UPI003D1C55F2
MAAFRLVSAGLALLLASCATTGSDVSAQEAVAGAAAIDCASYNRSDAPLVFHAMDPNVPAVWPTSRIVVPAGITIPISVGHFDPRRGIEPVPLQCMDFEISPSDAARISQDGLSIEIGADARPGSDIQLTGTLRGSREGSGSVTLRIVIIDDMARQLIGTWSFDAVRGCDGAEIDPPVEIRFEVDNGLSVTWTPFGRYWDYWGRYAWLPESGVFSFEPTGGNQIPPDIAINGELVLEGERNLSLSGVHFGTRERGAPPSSVSAADAGCTLVFRRQGEVPQ